MSDISVGGVLFRPNLEPGGFDPVSPCTRGLWNEINTRYGAYTGIRGTMEDEPTTGIFLVECLGSFPRIAIERFLFSVSPIPWTL
jgi:hypothetical protein